MNAAARALTQGIVLNGTHVSVQRLSISRNMLITFSLSIAIVCSALGVITVTDNNRIAYGNLASLQQTRDDLETTYGQLLLEKNTWVAPSRVEAIAEQNFAMSQPDQRKVIIIKP